jgi:membrane protein
MKFLKQFGWFIITRSQKHNIVNLSAQMSYRALLAFIPLLMLIYNFLNWISTELNTTLINALNTILPDFIMTYINFATENTLNTPTSSGTNLVFGFFILYTSTSAMYALIVSLTRIFGQKETRGIIALWIQSFIYLILFLLIILLTIFFYLFSEKVLDFIFMSLNLSENLSISLSIFGFFYIVCITTLFFTLLYMFAPKNPLNFFEALPGGIFVTIGWMSTIFLYYLFANTNINLINFFSNLQGPFSLCIVIFLICFLLNLGGVVNLYSFTSKKTPKEISEND